MVKNVTVVEQGRWRLCGMEGEFACVKDFSANVWRRLPDDETLLLVVHVYSYRSSSKVQIRVFRVINSAGVPEWADKLAWKRRTGEVKSVNLLEPIIFFFDKGAERNRRQDPCGQLETRCFEAVEKADWGVVTRGVQINVLNGVHDQRH